MTWAGNTGVQAAPVPSVMGTVQHMFQLFVCCWVSPCPPFCSSHETQAASIAAPFAPLSGAVLAHMHGFICRCFFHPTFTRFCTAIWGHLAVFISKTLQVP